MDVLMYWKETPVRGVEEAELPQFTILGYETNDRKVRSRIILRIHFVMCLFYFTGKTGYRNLPTSVAII